MPSAILAMMRSVFERRPIRKQPTPRPKQQPHLCFQIFFNLFQAASQLLPLACCISQHRTWTPR
jgi:hypothetical protein